MAHSYTKIWLHGIFATKDWQCLIHLPVEKIIHQHMRAELIEIGCPVRIINGMPNHVHLLFLQNPKLGVDNIFKQVKGSSSHWINDKEIIPEKFSWQTGYAAYSVSESQLERVFRYIANQNLIIRKYPSPRNTRNLFQSTV